MFILAKNFHASKELEQAQRHQTIGLKFGVISTDKRKTCGYSMIARSWTEVLKSLFSKWK